jgi:hypothetical protein
VLLPVKVPPSIGYLHHTIHIYAVPALSTAHQWIALFAHLGIFFDVALADWSIHIKVEYAGWVSGLSVSLTASLLHHHSYRHEVLCHHHSPLWSGARRITRSQP